MSTRFAVTLEQLATYIERDGWRRLAGPCRDHGSTCTAYGDGQFSAHVDDADLPALERARDAAYTSARTRQLARRGY